jgi:hypothetical protein
MPDDDASSGSSMRERSISSSKSPELFRWLVDYAKLYEADAESVVEKLLVHKLHRHDRIAIVLQTAEDPLQYMVQNLGLAEIDARDILRALREEALLPDPDDGTDATVNRTLTLLVYTYISP